MSRIIRRSLSVAVLALVAVPFTAVGSGAQSLPDLTFTVRKVVSGTGTGPSSVQISCVSEASPVSAQYAAVLEFDAQGNPTTSDDESFEIVDGAWTMSITNVNTQECEYTELTTGGAASTSWTCNYDFDPVSVPESTQVESAGCAAASGTGTGPVTVLYPTNSEVELQASTVTFTNTFTSTPEQKPQAAPQVVAQPTFTG